MGTFARALLVFGAVALLTAPAAVAATADRVDTVSAADQAAALAHWTPERMQQVSADPTEPGERTAQPWTGPAPAGVGRFFFTEVPGVDHWCTATAVTSKNRDTLITAAHCVHPGFTRDDTEIKVTNVVFVPGYDHGHAPRGVFAARGYVVPDDFSLAPRDVAMVVLATHNGRHISDVAGAQRIAFDTRPTGNASMFGYPGSIPVRGEFLLRCDVPVTFRPSSIGDTWDSPCDMAGGSSGGPFLTDFDGHTGTVFSVVSRGAMDVDLHTLSLEGPTLGDAANEVYQRASAM
ncbi:trypsin-like serine peptidase [Kutzneria sp. CA-103260]|uniref:trypsin-like serine peptidase n=1 Tax=Kutzneria sp. CA-103260 TaxID=2802641 RepID=UPI001BA502E9|nr:hypothetical protein [Kutzneria sp. CA-103260]QUQ68612.1 trypsin-like serine protease [Kutzneria sp. CA-103260]